MGRAPHRRGALPKDNFQHSAPEPKILDGTKLAGIFCEHLSVTFIRIGSGLQKLYRKNAWGGLAIRSWGGLPMRIFARSQ